LFLSECWFSSEKKCDRLNWECSTFSTFERSTFKPEV
jgi:hypothetical protein